MHGKMFTSYEYIDYLLYALMDNHENRKKEILLVWQKRHSKYLSSVLNLNIKEIRCLCNQSTIYYYAADSFNLFVFFNLFHLFVFELWYLFYDHSNLIKFPFEQQKNLEKQKPKKLHFNISFPHLTVRLLRYFNFKIKLQHGKWKLSFRKLFQCCAVLMLSSRSHWVIYDYHSPETIKISKWKKKIMFHFVVKSAPIVSPFYSHS